MSNEYCDAGRRDIYGSLHAEIHCILNLHKLNAYRRMLKKHDKINILVIRISPTGTVGYSRPCRGCVETMTRNKLFSVVNSIYYTDVDGGIIVEHVNQMNDTSGKYSSGRRRRIASHTTTLNNI
jgi:hypothetical protein